MAALTFVITGAVGQAEASDVSIHVDSAPNVYGSPHYDTWWDDTKQEVVDGSFTNLSNATFPGTNTIHPYDEIVYSTGDLGKRLHWIYWVPGKTTAELEDKFEVKFVIDWAGTDYTYDWSAGGWAADASNVGWIQPGSWEDYDGTTDGVIGTFGHAWWANDNDAEPLDTGGNAYDETDQADIDALRDSVFAYQTFATGYVRIKDNGNWNVSSLQTTVVPVPAAAWAGMALLGGMGGFAGLKRKLRRG